MINRADSTSGLGLIKPIARSPDCIYILWVTAILLYFRPDAIDVYRNGRVITYIIITPYL
jgi:hypothetical protein